MTTQNFVRKLPNNFALTLKNPQLQKKEEDLSQVQMNSSLPSHMGAVLNLNNPSHGMNVKGIPLTGDSSISPQLTLR